MKTMLEIGIKALVTNENISYQIIQAFKADLILDR